MRDCDRRSSFILFRKKYKAAPLFVGMGVQHKLLGYYPTPTWECY